MTAMDMAGLAVETALWTCQAYAAWIFLKSALHKVDDFAEVGEEFRRWGYARPAEVTFAVVVVWIFGSVGLLLPSVASLAAVVLIVAMLVAVAMERWEPGVFQLTMPASTFLAPREFEGHPLGRRATLPIPETTVSHNMDVSAARVPE